MSYSIFQETFCFCSRHLCNSSNSSERHQSSSFLLRIVLLFFFFFFYVSASPNSPCLSTTTSQKLLFLTFSWGHNQMSYLCPWLLSPFHHSSHCWPWNQVSETWSPIFNIPPWRSFNISPTGRKFRRLSELRGVERETPFISRSKSERIIIKPKN